MKEEGGKRREGGCGGLLRGARSLAGVLWREKLPAQQKRLQGTRQQQDCCASGDVVGSECMKFLFSSRAPRVAEPEPSCSDPAAAGPDPEAWAAAPEPEPESRDDEEQPRAPGSSTAAAVGDTAAAQQPAQAQAQAIAPNGAAEHGAIPVPNIPVDEPQDSIPARPVIIRGRSLCDMHSDEAVDHAERASSPIKMGQTPPLLSMIRQTAMETREDPTAWR